MAQFTSVLLAGAAAIRLPRQRLTKLLSLARELQSFYRSTHLFCELVNCLFVLLLDRDLVLPAVFGGFARPAFRSLIDR